jgi:hypothetical protein
VTKEREIVPSNKQQFFSVGLQEQATIAKQQHCNDQIFTSYIVSQEATTMTIFLSVVLQGAMSMVDCNDHTRSRPIGNQPFSLMWINHIDDHKDAKSQQ